MRRAEPLRFVVLSLVYSLLLKVSFLVVSPSFAWASSAAEETSSASSNLEAESWGDLGIVLVQSSTSRLAIRLTLFPGWSLNPGLEFGLNSYDVYGTDGNYEAQSPAEYALLLRQDVPMVGSWSYRSAIQVGYSKLSELRPLGDANGASESADLFYTMAQFGLVHEPLGSPLDGSLFHEFGLTMRYNWLGERVLAFDGRVTLRQFDPGAYIALGFSF